MTTAVITRDLIIAQTRALKLPGVARVFESTARQARDAHWPHEDYLHDVLSAEQAFYWNVVSHSLLIRLYNQLPIVQFDHGHLIRTAPAIYDRIVRWYYQGWAPPLRNHREPLTPATVENWTAGYRPHAARLVERYRRAPSPEQMIADLMSRAPTPGIAAELVGR